MTSALLDAVPGPIASALLQVVDPHERCVRVIVNPPTACPGCHTARSFFVVRRVGWRWRVGCVGCDEEGGEGGDSLPHPETA